MPKKEYYENEHGALFSDEVLCTPLGRAGWPQVVRPGKKFGKKGVAVVFEKSVVKASKAARARIKEIEAECNSLIDAAGYTGKKITALAIRDGDLPGEDEEGNESPAPFPGHYYIIARTKDEDLPIVERDGVTAVDPKLIKPGVKIRTMIRAKWFNSGPQKGISFTLDLIQFLGDDGFRFPTNKADPKKLLPKLSDDEEEELGDEEADAAPPVTAAGKKKKKPVSDIVPDKDEDEEEEEEEEETPKVGKKKKAPPVEEEDEEEEEEDEDEEEESDDDDSDDEEEEEEDEDEEEEEEEEVKPKKKTKKASAKASPPPKGKVSKQGKSAAMTVL